MKKIFLLSIIVLSELVSLDKISKYKLYIFSFKYLLILQKLRGTRHLKTDKVDIKFISGSYLLKKQKTHFMK